jgi:hypothetical protein
MWHLHAKHDHVLSVEGATLAAYERARWFNRMVAAHNNLVRNTSTFNKMSD